MFNWRKFLFPSSRLVVQREVQSIKFPILRDQSNRKTYISNMFGFLRDARGETSMHNQGTIVPLSAFMYSSVKCSYPPVNASPF